MTSEPLGMLADITAAIVIMFIFPLLCVNAMKERISDRYVHGITSHFAETVCSKGYIDEELYEAFITELAGTGKYRNIEITERVPRYEPVYESGVFTGEVTEYEEVLGTEELLTRIYSEDGCELARGAGISIEIYDGGLGLVRCSGTVKGRAKR